MKKNATKLGQVYIDGRLLRFDLINNLHIRKCLVLFLFTVGLFIDVNAQCPEAAPTCYDVCAAGSADKDGDGVPDNVDLDSDNDGILNSDEGCVFEQVLFVDDSDNVAVSACGVTMTATIPFFTDPNNVRTDDRIDNPNYTIVSGAASLEEANFLYVPTQISTFPMDFTLSFSGPDVFEVYVHMNSLDKWRLEFLASENPGIAYTVLSGETFVNLGAGTPDLNWGDTDPSSGDATGAQERQDFGGPSADGTILFSSTNGSPITVLELNTLAETFEGGDGWSFAVEVLSYKDTDGDGIYDYVDLDSDNDGIPDAIEACGDIALTLDQCSLATDVTDPTMYGTDPATGCSNGLLLTACTTAPEDTDGDGIPDFLDLDSDGDGCADSVEAGTDGSGTSDGSTYTAGTVDDCGLLTTGISGTCPIPGDTNWTDSTVETACEDCDTFIGDGAGLCAAITAGNTALGMLDCDAGGIDNATECAAGGDPTDDTDDVVVAPCPTGGPDKDGDGVPDDVDLDSDNDGILNSDEGCVFEQVLFVDDSDNVAVSACGVTMNATIPFFTDPNNVRTDDRIDNPNYTIVSGAASLEEANFLYVPTQIATFPMDFTLSFSGPDVFEVYVHMNSLDKWRLEFLASENPGIAYTVLSGETFVNLGAGTPDLNWGDTDPSSGDATGAQERQDFGGPSADGTILFSSTNGSPITVLELNTLAETFEGGDGWSFAVEVLSYKDTDGDGIYDYVDLDSDNDGIPDAIEACGDIALSLDQCSLATDVTDPTMYGVDPVTGCNNGLLLTACTTAPEDTDGDGIPDFLDLDSDDDGCADSVEAGTDGSGTSDGSTYTAGTVDDCGLLTSGISGTCPVPGDTEWIDDSADSACDCDYFEDNGIDICTHLLDFPDASIASLDCDGGGVDNATECTAGTDPSSGNAADDCDALAGDGAAICAIIAADSMSPLATLDCDGGGVDNATECAAGTDPTDPIDDLSCDDFLGDGAGLCAFIAANPTSALATEDCDDGGADNATECAAGTDPSGGNPQDDCMAFDGDGAALCALITADPMNPLATLDCDGGGVDNATECAAGTDPSGGNAADDCDALAGDGAAICAIIAADPMSPLATLDCDGGGADNATECAAGTDPSGGNPQDDCAAFDGNGPALCALIAADPTSPLATLDCDGGGVDNASECAAGTDPAGGAPEDDCLAFDGDGAGLCALITADPMNPLATLDCDGGGVDNATECAAGTDPSGGNPQDDCTAAIDQMLDICAIITADPTSPLATADCDGGGIDNATECTAGNDPADPVDDSSCSDFVGDGAGLCAFLAANPTSTLATADCDGGGADNATECAAGTDPSGGNPQDDCMAFDGDGAALCALITADPASPLATLDCDGGGVDNATECAAGTDPSGGNPGDDCTALDGDGAAICAIIAADPASPLATLDCDGGGADNATECAAGTDPSGGNPADDCAAFAGNGPALCAVIAADPTSPLATLDCDGGGVDNATECNNGTDPSPGSEADDYNCDNIATAPGGICAFITANSMSPIATLDCDGGGVDNLTECLAGDDPTDPADDFDCDNAATIPGGICGYITANPTSNIATLDCDGGGVDNATECANGDDPSDPADDFDCATAIANGDDICAIIAANPSSVLATLDCDGGGVSNATECANGDDPTNPADDYDCTSIVAAGVDICAYIAANPGSDIASLDCDMGGVDNQTECANGDDPSDPADDFDCATAIANGDDICAIIAANPSSVLATLDCDGGGVNNATECALGDDPADPSDDYDCTSIVAAGVDICAYIAANPGSDIASLDCDMGGVDNQTECANGDDPTDPADDLDCATAIANGDDICALIIANPGSVLATMDCDGGGVDNLTECLAGDDPADPSDDYDCTTIVAAGVDICAYIAANPGSDIASLDCDMGGVDNQTECANGDDPTDPVDDFDCVQALANGDDICALIAANPTSVLATADCDGGGVDNATECANGDDPADPSDDYDCMTIVADGVDICSYIAANPGSAIASLDCDGGGISNAIECANGDDPTDPADDFNCAQAITDGLDICAIIAANPTSTLATMDCDGGGIDNATECAAGDDPADPSDDFDCTSIVAAGVDICGYIAANPTSDIATLDCDMGGVDNATECANGDDPTDPVDDYDCAQAIQDDLDICAYITANPTAQIATLDCDGGGVDNATECAAGDDPTDPADDYNCTTIVAAGVDICSYIAANPGSNIASLDCDGGGIDNQTECAAGDDPTDPADDYDCDSALADGLDLCVLIAANPTSVLATMDCDGGGVDNATECANGNNPADPSDDYDCMSIVAAGVDICSYIASNPGSAIASLDCDGGGVDNQTECANGDDPTDPVDDFDCDQAIANGVDICALITANPTSVLATADCDGGGVDNATECANGDDPADPSDDYDCISIVADGVDICSYIAANPGSAIASLDCDGGGISNQVECANGDDPTDPADDADCATALANGEDICAIIAANPTSVLATMDCDGGGVDNATECAAGDDPADPSDDYDCTSIVAAGVDICGYIAAFPTSDIATLDCDGGGVSNVDECANGDDPTDPADDYDCDQAVQDGLDICAYITMNPTSEIATLDCDGGGVDNATECAAGDDPTDPADDYDCASIVADGVDICGYIAAFPTSAIATMDCDGGGVDNATECNNGTDPSPGSEADDYDCDNIATAPGGICAYILANPTSIIATLDCDGGGVDNLTECQNGDDPTDPADDYDCMSIVADGIDICAYIAANPGSNIASLDCDGGGISNQVECANGDDPTDPADDFDCTQALANGVDICALIAANPTSVLATADCDGGGVDNSTECAAGDDPADPSDDYDCASIVADGVDICGYIAANPTSAIASLDCDGGGVSNAVECANGDDPTDPVDDFDCASAIANGQDICALIAANPTSVLATADCDGGGVDNATECAAGDDPADPSDDYDCASIVADGVDICSYIAANPGSAIASLDCDGGGINNATECANGDDPTDPADDYNCASAIADGLDICALIAANPTSALATMDCDGGGVDNATECANGDDPSNPADDYDCVSIVAAGVDICSYIAANPGSAIASLDCDGGGISNQVECANGDDPTDPADDFDCAQALANGDDICAIIAANPSSVLATLDCDGGGVDNATECANGDDPANPADDYDCASIAADGVDICSYIAANPGSAIASLDCDGGGINNATECANGDDPNDPADDFDCAQALANGDDICAIIAANPSSVLATLDCDGGGVDNATECANGDDPANPADDYDCASIAADGVDICSYIAANPGSAIASLDCDGGGISNQVECANGDDPSDPADDYNCASAIADGLDICALIAANPTSALATMDCDAGGVDNFTECFGAGASIGAGGSIIPDPDPTFVAGDPANPADDYDCESIVAAGIDICGYIFANPTSTIAALDCDGGGVNNAAECAQGDDPNNPVDDFDCAQAISNGLDICAIIAANPTAAIATADCDGGGIDNATECANGDNPSDPDDDFDCVIAAAENIDICTYIAANPFSDIATLDCDGGGVDNRTECQNGGDPSNPSDDFDCASAIAQGVDICAVIASNPSSALASLDCDGGGVSNADECANGQNPADASDDCASLVAAGVDLCELINGDPNHPLASLDCDGGGIDNLTECINHTDPLAPGDDCTAACAAGLDIHTLIAGNRNHPLASADCDGGGVNNFDECVLGNDPCDQGDDDCEAFAESGADICVAIAANPDALIATLDCDGGGVSNGVECAQGQDPNDPTDDCTAAIGADILCDLILADNTNPLAQQDCDGGGVPNIYECQAGTDPGVAPGDDCEAAVLADLDLCVLINNDPAHPLAQEDCDGGGVSNFIECQTGEEPGQTPGDDCAAAVNANLDLCVLINNDSSHPLAHEDCDGGGVSNFIECQTGEEPGQTPEDDCAAAVNANLDLCVLINNDPTHPFAQQDCDGGGVTNIIECQTGEEPGFTPEDDCQSAIDADILTTLSADLTNPLFSADCDGDGTPNGEDADPLDPCVDPQSFDDTLCSQMLDECSINTYVFLEGSLIGIGIELYGSQMRTDLNDQGLLPGELPFFGFATATPAGHPYSGAPWNHTATTGAGFTSADYPSDVTDWVLVELRSGFDASTEICTHAGFVHSDGRVTFPDGCNCNLTPGEQVRIAIKHRNHLPVISPLVVVDNNGQANFDFRMQDSFRASPFDLGQLPIPGGIWAMIAANGDQTATATSQGDVEANDNQVWLDRNSDNDQYSPADYDMNGDVNSNDKFVWLKNNLTSGTLPN